MHKQESILAIDRGSRYVGLAYKNTDSEVIFPIGYLLNDQMIFFNIADLIVRYHVVKIMIGRPSKQVDVQEKIKKFIQGLSWNIDKENIEVQYVEEDYTSVQSGEIMSNFKKNAAEDTISAMLILERGLKK
jgi:RNase H-fold protein (predicted Holliday junction resolvase)